MSGKASDYIPGLGRQFTISPEEIDIKGLSESLGVERAVIDSLSPTFTISRNKWYQGVLNTPDVDTTFRTKHEALCDCHSLQLVYGNFYQDDDPTRLPNLDTYTIKCVIEVVKSGQTRFIDVTFKGDMRASIQPGAQVTSDPVGLEFSKGDTFYVRAHVTTASAGKFPHAIVGFLENGEGKMAGDQTKAASFSAQTLATLSPMAIYATPTERFRTVALVGDSISLGAGNANGNNDGHPFQGEFGFMQLAAMRAGMGYVTLGMNGQATNGFQPHTRHRRMVLASSCDIAVVNYGTNDMTASRTLEEIKANLMDAWKALKMRGLKVYQTTITPRTNEASKWPTEGQVPVNDRTAGGPTTVRSLLNDWIRTVPSPHLDGYVEVADAVETARNSGLWKAGMTTDGIHPNEQGHKALTIVLTDVLNSI